MLRTQKAAIVLAVGLLAGHAEAEPILLGPYFYATSSTAPAAADTPASLLPLSNEAGGLCVPGVGDCPSLPPTLAGPLVGGLIEFATPSLSSGAHYLLSLNVQDLPGSLVGDIFAVVLDGIFLGTTSVTGVGDKATDYSFGLFETIIHGGTHTIGITNLLQQYSVAGARNTLPGLLGSAQLNDDPDEIVPSSFNLAVLTVTAFLTPAPEPATLALLGSGAFLLGAWRWRSRQ